MVANHRKFDAASSSPSSSSSSSSQPLAKKTRRRRRRRLFTTRRRAPRKSPNSRPVPDIPFEIFAVILARLPVKSLLRFRCVCKSLNALISDPNFAKEQLRASSITHSTHRHHLIVAFGDPQRECSILLDDYSLPSLFSGSIASFTQRKFPFRWFLDASCHGLLLCDAGKGYYSVWNPLTGKSKDLPSLKIHRPKLSFVVHGFGHDHLSDSYKVVVLFHGVSNKLCMVHTLGTNSWRAIQGCPGVTFDGDRGKFVSGKLNWLARPIGDLSSWFQIVSLDLGTETFQQLSLPEFGAGVDVVKNLQVLNGCLCILADRNIATDVWLMKEYGNKDSWTKVFTVPRMGKKRPKIHAALSISDDDEEILVESSMSLDVYNSKSDTFKKAGVRKFKVFRFSGVFVESLISPC